MIAQFLEELTVAEKFELIRIHGYGEILSMPERLLSDLARAEVDEALKWSLERQKRIAVTIEAVKFLSDHDYPFRVQQIAPEPAIEELKDRLEMMRLAVAEFETAPTGTVVISEEIPVN